MKFSLNWLKDYVDISDRVTPQQLAEKLTLHVAEVEEVIEQKKSFEKMVVGKIVTIENHPNADKLKVCRVDSGKSGELTIICGGKNIYEGMKVAVALPGSFVKWHGEGDLIELQKTKIRGVESDGMICAAAEIGIDDPEGHPANEPYVVDLKLVPAEAGAPLGEALGMDDVIFDIENKSITNRPDLWGHYGMAREIAALYKLPLELYGLNRSDKTNKSDRHITLTVDIQAPDLCKRYMGVVINGIKIGPSPDWMQRRLRAVGQRPINNIVDISNYVMFDCGQPSHMFDAQKLMHDNQKDGIQLIVREARMGEQIQTLDGTLRKLEPGMIIIANCDKADDVAGVMGGASSEINDTTQTLVIEVANFNAPSIRKTAASLGIRTEASARFEKSLDASPCDRALAKLIGLIQEAVPGVQIASEIVDVGEWRTEVKPIALSFEFINKKIGGKTISGEQIKDILLRLGFGVERTFDRSNKSDRSDRIVVTPPSWRATGDISIPEDIVEEVARSVGYNDIHLELPLVRMNAGIHVPLLELTRRLKQYLVQAAGLSEVQNYSFVSAREVAPWGFSEKDLIAMENPPATDVPFLRPLLLPGIWGVLERNAGFFEQFGIFEIGSVFLTRQGADTLPVEPGGDMLPSQPTHLAVAIVGPQAFSRAKGLLEGLGEWGGWNVHFEASKLPEYLDPRAGLRVFFGGHEAGVAGLLSKKMSNTVRAGAVEIALLEATLDILAQTPISVVKYKEASRFPAVKRDIAFVVSEGVRYRDVVEVFDNVTLLAGYELFDVYGGAKIGEGKKSMAFHLEFRDQQRTLADREVQEELGQIITSLQKKLSADIRS